MVLVFGIEGATDPDIYAALTAPPAKAINTAAQAQLDAVTSHCKMTDCVRNPSHTPGALGNVSDEVLVGIDHVCAQSCCTRSRSL